MVCSDRVRCYSANSTQFQHIANCWICKQKKKKKVWKKSLKKLITKILRETLLMNRNWRVVQKMVHSMHGWPSGKKEVMIWLQPNIFSIFSFRLEKKIEKYNYYNFLTEIIYLIKNFRFIFRVIIRWFVFRHLYFSFFYYNQLNILLRKLAVESSHMIRLNKGIKN